MQAADRLNHHTAAVNGIQLHYVEAGTGPLVVLLHGFPEFWYAWRHQIPALAVAGFHVVAPDLRGYHRSEKPAGVHNYRMELLVEDVAALIRHAGAERAAVVGHDWGGAIAWHTAIRRPAVVERLVVLNAPHPAAFARALRHWEQRLRSWYILFFQLPWLPEVALRLGNGALLERMLRTEPVRAGAFSDDDIRRYKEALAQPGAPTAMLNYYRAALRGGGALRASATPVRVPTLLIWGEQDRYLGTELTHGLDALVPDLRVERLPNASHWVMADAPERVNSLLTRFLRAE